MTIEIESLNLGGYEYVFPKNRKHSGVLKDAYAINRAGGYDLLFTLGRGFTIRGGKIVEGTMSIDFLPQYNGTPMNSEEQAFADAVCALR